MAFNKAKEELKWKIRKEKEEEILRSEGMSESKITILRKYDWEEFKRERNIRRAQDVTSDEFFDLIPTYDSVNCSSLDDIEEHATDHRLLKCLKEFDELKYIVIDLRVKGYRYNEIAKILNRSDEEVYYLVKQIKEDLKFLKEFF